MQGLTFLSLASTAIGDAGLTAVSPHLKNLRRLCHLSLADAGLTAAATKPLLQALPPMRALEHLDLARNAFDVAGHVALAPLLAALPGLRYLDNVGARFTAHANAPPTILPPTLSSLSHLSLQVCRTPPPHVPSPLRTPACMHCAREPLLRGLHDVGAGCAWCLRHRRGCARGSCGVGVFADRGCARLWQ